jgi:hypothetical protein
MRDHHVDEGVNRLSSRLSRRTRRWALGSLVAAVAAGTTRVGAEARRGSHQNPSIVDLLELQMQQNHLSQLAETATRVVDAANPSSTTPVRGIK